MTNRMEKGLILTPLTSESAAQHRTKSAAALEKVRKSVLGTPVTRFGTATPVQVSPCKKPQVDLGLSFLERQKDKQVMCHPG